MRRHGIVPVPRCRSEAETARACRSRSASEGVALEANSKGAKTRAEAQVRKGGRLLVGLEQGGQGLGRPPRAERGRGGKVGLGVLEHLEQVGERRFVADLGQGHRGAVPQPPVLARQKPDAVWDDLGGADGDGNRPGERGFPRVGGLPAIQKGLDELRTELPQRLDRAVLGRALGFA